MNEKEVAEIRRRFRADKGNITHVRGCYVNEKGEIVSQFDQSLTLMPQEESEKVLTVLKKTLSGSVGKNLVDVNFSTRQVIDSPEHGLLMALRQSKLKEDEIVQSFYEKVIACLHIEGTYLILLACDTYDVPCRAKDGEKIEEASDEVFSYVLCSICPVKTSKPALCYSVVQNAFCSPQPEWLVAPPQLGFLFPAFDDRSANIYGALYYTRDTAKGYTEFTDAVFGCPMPKPAKEQQDSFQNLLGETLEQACSLEAVQSVHEGLCAMIEEHKARKVPEPLRVSRQEISGLLQSGGVATERIEAFEKGYREVFGPEETICPQNLMNQKQFEVRTPDVTIRINPQRSDLVQTRIIGGARYILIRAEEGVEVNGVAIHISAEEKK